jgi:hypothetical protein
MTDEPGSDELLAQLADPDAIDEPVLEQQQRLTAEEQRVQAQPPADDEPGHQHPDPDQTPPADGMPEYDPLPPE